MSFRDWEDQVEFYDSLPQGLVRRLDRKFKEVNLGIIKGTESKIAYKAKNNREVTMRVLGFSASHPVVKAEVKKENGEISQRNGILLGCVHPEEKLIIDGLLRTHHFPVLFLPIDNENQLLPTPISQLRIHQAKIR